MTRKLKATGRNVPVPQDDSEAREAIREIGDMNRQVLRLEAELNDKVAALQKEYGDLAAPIREQVVARQEGLQTYCEAHRQRLTTGGKVKFHRFSTGEISWRLRPARVSIRGADAVIDSLKAAGLRQFLRVKEEINKEAMLDDRPTAMAIKGVTIGSDGEDFLVEPYETELAEGGV